MQDEPDNPSPAPFFKFVALLFPICVFVFLVASSFFSAWEGQVVSVAPTEGDESVLHQVLVIDENRDTFILTWPSSIIAQIETEVDRRLLPPITVKDEFPDTKKDRFSLSFTVEGKSGHAIVAPTTTPFAVATALLAGLLLLVLRNMYVSGSPFNIFKRALELPKGQAAHGQVPQRKQERSKKTAPPSRRKSKRRR